MTRERWPCPRPMLRPALVKAHWLRRHCTLPCSLRFRHRLRRNVNRPDRHKQVATSSRDDDCDAMTSTRDAGAEALTSSRDAGGDALTSRNAGGDASCEDDETQSDVIALIDDDDTHSDAGSTDIDNGVGKCAFASHHIILVCIFVIPCCVNASSRSDSCCSPLYRPPCIDGSPLSMRHYVWRSQERRWPRRGAPVPLTDCRWRPSGASATTATARRGSSRRRRRDVTASTGAGCATRGSGRRRRSCTEW